MSNTQIQLLRLICTALKYKKWHSVYTISILRGFVSSNQLSIILTLTVGGISKISSNRLIYAQIYFKYLIHAQPDHKNTRDTTMCIKHLADSADFKAVTFN